MRLPLLVVFTSSFLVVNAVDTSEKCNHIGPEGETEECRRERNNPSRVIHPDGTEKNSQLQILIFARSTDTDSYRQCLRTARINELNVTILTPNPDDLDGYHKIHLVKREIEKYVGDQDKIIMFLESFEILFLGKDEEIIKEFKASKARILFAAEATSGIDLRVSEQFPDVRGRRFLSPRGYIGYARDLYSLFEFVLPTSKELDETFFIKSYLNAGLRSELEMAVDSESSIFYILNDAVSDEVVVAFKDGRPSPMNIKYDTTPLVIFGAPNQVGPARRTALNNLGNYLADNWDEVNGCNTCDDGMISLKGIKDEEFPIVVLGIFVERPIPFLEEFIEKIDALDYPKERIHIYLHNTMQLHEVRLNEFLEAGTRVYASVKLVLPIHIHGAWEPRKLAIDHCIAKNCDYYFSVDAEAHFDNPMTLQRLIEQNRGIVAPLLPTSGYYRANFWGAVTPTGIVPVGSNDYVDIIMGRRKGLWNVPFISHAYLINGSLIKNEKTRPDFIAPVIQAQPDLAFCFNNRDRDIFMYLSNREEWGHLVNSDNFWVGHRRSEMYEVIENRKDWEARYLHPDWEKLLEQTATLEQPCPDAFRFPILTERFCKEVVDTAENSGVWHHAQEPQAQGYVPSVDIQLVQLGFDMAFSEILRSYVVPLKRKVWIRYEDNPRRTRVSFISRYKPEELAGLRPHEDDSQYSTNLALNDGFEGGGVRFIRHNCSISDTKKGWMIMHPGSSTHYHESLKTTTGTRYILVSFMKTSK